MELGCGGYIAKSVDTGASVMSVVIAVGDVFFHHLDRVVSSEERLAECRASMDVLGVNKLEVLYRDKDRLLDTVPIADIVDKLDQIQRDFRPNEVLMPLPSSHQDHDIAYRACIAATRPSAYDGCLQLIAAYEYPATSWGSNANADAGKGGMYVELADRYLDQKLEALRQYNTQMRNDKHCFSLEASRALARMRGLEAGLHNAELLHVMRMIVR
jgi:LmbE family N-acetylglucosaminyl deacetylase